MLDPAFLTVGILIVLTVFVALAAFAIGDCARHLSRIRDHLHDISRKEDSHAE